MAVDFAGTEGHEDGPWKAVVGHSAILVHGYGTVCELDLAGKHLDEDYPGGRAEYITRQKANAALVEKCPEMKTEILELRSSLSEALAWIKSRSGGGEEDLRARLGAVLPEDHDRGN